LEVLSNLSKVYGANSMSLVKEIAFSDNELNLSDLICEIFILVVQKTDQTSIDLSDKNGTH